MLLKEQTGVILMLNEDKGEDEDKEDDVEGANWDHIGVEQG